MADEQISITSFLLCIVLSGLAIRWLFFSPAATTSTTASRGTAQSAQRAREAAVERVQQMFPHLDRRTILWDLQRNGGNISATTERILAGRMEAPPITFQPPPPPTSASPSGASQPGVSKAPTKPAEPDLITRYKLQDKITPKQSEAETTKGKAWSSNRDERQAALQRRRDDMILAARRRMEAKLAAEKGGAQGT
ncbi:Uu.00g017300.m01.CDS01 [Anthostomella pinea]|uniref:Coupling of ubiquitin conjugation to ER degradation protein 1 n=1 Tax=Anthostomella pinea TaxID=933095 RepID=A0AAI8YQM9_9PEZI|nr:Uu.00g017300.m01.CDS01 [Anthostomella pinea]